MRARISQFAGWLVTSPVAFFVAFVIDVAASALAALKRRTRAS